MNAIRRYLAAVPGSIAGHVNIHELWRAIYASGAVALLADVTVSVLQVVSADAAAIFPDPGIATRVVFAIGLTLDVYRRLNHGTPPPGA